MYTDHDGVESCFISTDGACSAPPEPLPWARGEVTGLARVLGPNLAKGQILANVALCACASGKRSCMFRVKVPYGFTCSHFSVNARRSVGVSRPCHMGSASTCWIIKVLM